MFAPCSATSCSRSLSRAATLVLISLFAAGCAGVSAQKQQQQQQLPTLSLSSTAFNFNSVVVGQTATQTLLISSTGTAALEVSALSVSNNQFSLAGPSVPYSLLPGNSATYTVAFSPTSSGSLSATVSITTNAASTPASISLVGTGVKAAANLVATPASVNFGNITLNSTGTQNVTLQNAGNINLTVQSVTAAGAGFGYSALSSGLSLSPNQTVTFQVSFSPTVAGSASGTVSIQSPNLPSPATISLTGVGVSAPPPVQHTVHLTWGASTSQVIGYRVYRSEASGAFLPLNGTAINALSYDDATVALSTTYSYYVTAVDASGSESVPSNQATAVIPSS